MAYLQFLSRQTVVRFWAILVMATLFSAGIFPADCRAWIFFHKPEYKGKVIDAEKEEPIEGVAVVAVYWTHQFIGGPAGPDSREIHWKEVLTDAKGIFRIPSYMTLISPNSYAGETRFIFYKPGYRSSPVWPGPDFLWILGADKFFTEEIGKTGEKELGIKKIKTAFTYGVIQLKPANTWDERRLSRPSGPLNSTEDELPVFNHYLNKEREWLYKNKEWRRDEKN
jgi:hypothetical protein